MSTPTEFNVKINVQLSLTVLRHVSHFHLAIFSSCLGANHYTLGGVGQDHFQICANTAFRRSIFLPILKPSYAMWYVWSGMFVLYRVYKGSLGLVPSTHSLPHLPVLRPGSQMSEVQHTAVLQLLCDFAYVSKG